LIFNFFWSSSFSSKTFNSLWPEIQQFNKDDCYIEFDEFIKTDDIYKKLYDSCKCLYENKNMILRNLFPSQRKFERYHYKYISIIYI